MLASNVTLREKKKIIIILGSVAVGRSGQLRKTEWTIVSAESRNLTKTDRAG